MTVQKYASKSHNPFLHHYFKPSEWRTNKQSNLTSVEKIKWTTNKSEIPSPSSTCSKCPLTARAERSGAEPGQPAKTPLGPQNPSAAGWKKVPYPFHFHSSLLSFKFKKVSLSINTPVISSCTWYHLEPGCITHISPELCP